MKYGYKMHMISDAVHGIPLYFTITPANVNDSNILPGLLKDTLTAYPWLKPNAITADRGYDSEPNHKAVVGHNIIPVIHIRKPTAEDGLYNGIFNAEWKPLCPGGNPMDYVRTDPTYGDHLFRCPPEGCPLKVQGTKATTHCDLEIWEAPEDNLRVLGPLPPLPSSMETPLRDADQLGAHFPQPQAFTRLGRPLCDGTGEDQPSGQSVRPDLSVYGPGPSTGQGPGADAADDSEDNIETSSPSPPTPSVTTSGLPSG